MTLLFIENYRVYTVGGTQLWVTRHVPPKNPTFFRSLSPIDPHFYQLSPDDPLFFTKSLSPKDPDTSLSLKDPSFSHLIVKQITSFGKNGIFRQIWRNVGKFWSSWPWMPPFSCIALKDLLFLCVTERPPFLTQLVTERPLHLRCLVTLVRHFHV